MTEEFSLPPDTAPSVTPTVAQGILSQFFDALAAAEDLADIAPKLRKLVLENRVYAEPAVRAALFPDAP